MAKQFHLTIATPHKTIYDGQVVSLVAPSELGYMGVLVDHAPIIANLMAGKITVRDVSGSSRIFDLTGRGILEVLNNSAVILSPFVQQ